MSSSKTFKFQGSTIAVLTGFSDDGSPAVTKAITGITKANPAVVTSTAHGYADGDVIHISGIVGMTELNDTVQIIDVLTVDTYALVGVDSTGYGTWASGGVTGRASFSNFCELTGYNQQGGSKPEIDATSLCSTAAEFELGLQDFGTTQIDFKFAPRTPIQLAIQAFNKTGDLFAVRVDLPKAGGRLVQLGFVQQLSTQVQLNGIWTGSLTIRNTGERADFDGVGA